MLSKVLFFGFKTSHEAWKESNKQTKFKRKNMEKTNEKPMEKTWPLPWSACHWRGRSSAPRCPRPSWASSSCPPNDERRQRRGLGEGWEAAIEEVWCYKNILENDIEFNRTLKHLKPYILKRTNYTKALVGWFPQTLRASLKAVMS